MFVRLYPDAQMFNYIQLITSIIESTQWIRHPTHTVLRVQILRAHGDIIIINCAVQHLSAKLTLEVQFKCDKIKLII